MTLSIQHAPGVFAAEQHELVLPVVSGELAELEARGLAGISDLPLENFILNGMGDFIIGGPEGDNGLSGKKLAVDFYGPEIPIGGGAICGEGTRFLPRLRAARLLQRSGKVGLFISRSEEFLKNEIVLFESRDGAVTLPVPVRDESVWITRMQMADLFRRDTAEYHNPPKKGVCGR